MATSTNTSASVALDTSTLDALNAQIAEYKAKQAPKGYYLVLTNNGYTLTIKVGACRELARVGVGLPTARAYTVNEGRAPKLYKALLDILRANPDIFTEEKRG